MTPHKEKEEYLFRERQKIDNHLSIYLSDLLPYRTYYHTTTIIMVFQTKAVQSLLAKQAKIVSSKASSRSLSAIPMSASSSEPATAAAAAADVSILDDSFAFYPIQKNRIVKTSSNPTQSKECFSYYPSTGVTERKITLREATATYASMGKPTFQTKEESEESNSILNDPIIQQRLMQLKNQKTTTTDSSSTTTESQSTTKFSSSTVDDGNSFAYYPVQNHRSIQACQPSKEPRECFSFYYPSSSSNASSSFKTTGSTTATLEGEKATMLTPDKMKEIHYDETDSSFSAIVEKKGISFETATPSPTSRSVTSSPSSSSSNTTGTTNWESVMHALNKASSTTVVLP